MKGKIVEQRILHIGDIQAILSYGTDGLPTSLTIEFVDSQGTRRLEISSASFPVAPETIYEQLRECEVTFT